MRCTRYCWAERGSVKRVVSGALGVGRWATGRLTRDCGCVMYPVPVHAELKSTQMCNLRTRDAAFARMAPPIRFVLAVPVETADAEEAASSAESSRRSSIEGPGLAAGAAHGAARSSLPRLLGALCLADFKVRVGVSVFGRRSCRGAWVAVLWLSVPYSEAMGPI